MYSYTPNGKFLVLAPYIRQTRTSKFLVLAPTESGPLSVTDDQTETESTVSSQGRERSDSESSAATDLSGLSGGFLYLGHDRRSS